MVMWRRAFCTSIPKDREPKVLTEKQHHNNGDNPTIQSPKLTSKFGFFSNPSTPRCQSQPVSASSSLRCRTSVAAAAAAATTCSDPNSPKLQCRNLKTPRSSSSSHLSNPSSPKSPSSFSLLKATLRLSKSRCGICMQSVKSGQGTAIFTAECSHTFHFPCIASHVTNHPIHVCPVCATTWKELPVLAIHTEKQSHKISEENSRENRDKRPPFKVYNDDEPLKSPPSVSRFNPIPESENEDEEEQQQQDTEFQGFNVNPSPSSPITRRKNIEVCLLPEAAIVAGNRNYETYVVVLKVKPPKAARRSPLDLVAVLDVGGAMSPQKLRLMKSSMRMVISSLGPDDRLSIVAFSAGSKRLLSLRRMTGSGQRSARRIVEALAAIDQPREGVSAKNDALKKAAKVLEDRREKNAVTSVIVLSDIPGNHHAGAGAVSIQPSLVTTTRLPHLEVPVHAVRFPKENNKTDLTGDAVARSICGLLNVVAEDVRIQLAVVSRPRPVEIAAVYSLAGRPAALGSGTIRIGDLHGEEERELLVELKVPAASAGSHHVLTVLSSYRDPLTHEALSPNEQAMLVPRPHTVRSSCDKIEGLRNLHVTARAVAESSRLAEHGDLSGAHHLLSAARALLLQSSSHPADEYLSWLEAEQAEIQRRRQCQTQRHSRNSGSRAEEKMEPLTPTSAWRAAERLAKVAIMRKSMNRVSDLHGFENARF